MEQSTYLVQRSQVNAVLNFALSAYSGGASRVRGPIRLERFSLRFCLACLITGARDCYDWAVEIG